ncbi:MAG TPA: HAD-IIB family hydrolase [Polyangiaceae bacterium]
MRYLAFATDYDGTLAHHGRVDAPTLEALRKLRSSGRKLLLVTGRQIDDLQQVFPELALFDCVVAENGALLYWPETRQERLLAASPPADFSAELRERGVEPLSVGRVIVATWEPNERVVLDTIRQMGLDLQVIFNKGAVMVLPAGVNKRSGLVAALDTFALSLHNTVAVGDAENDHAFLSACECSVAVANALEAVKQTADFVTKGDHGSGVCELIDLLVESDLQELERGLRRHHVLLGWDDEGRELKLPPYGTGVLVSGVSGGGKSTAVSGMLERLCQSEYQFCLIDPEGDYDGMPGALRVGNARQAPDLDEVLQIFVSPRQNAIVNLLGVPLLDRPQFFAALLARLEELRGKLGRPHWLIIDEAHHMLHKTARESTLASAHGVSVLMITVHPDEIQSGMLDRVQYVLAVGAEPEPTLRAFAQAAGVQPPVLKQTASDQRLFLWARDGGAVTPLTTVRGTHERRRHVRKYAEGELGPDKSFYFRGKDGKLKLRAQNLILFNQIAEGVDDETWLFHLQNGDVSRWFRDAIKDEELAGEAEALEKGDLSVAQGRAAIREAIEKRYTLPAR